MSLAMIHIIYSNKYKIKKTWLHEKKMASGHNCSYCGMSWLSLYNKELESGGRRYLLHKYPYNPWSEIESQELLKVRKKGKNTELK